MFPVDPKYLSTFIFMMRVTAWMKSSWIWWGRKLSRAINSIYWRMVVLIIEMNGPRYLGFSWISVSNTVTLSKIQQKGFGKRPDDALKTCSWNLQKLSHVERSCLPTLFWSIYFLTNGSFGLPRTCTFILGCAIAFSKKSRFSRGSPLYNNWYTILYKFIKSMGVAKEVKNKIAWVIKVLL